MTLQGVPWAIGGGALIPVEALRLVGFVAAGGREGVIGPGSLQVLPLNVPGAGVRVMPGSAAVLNRNSGGGQQAYLVRNPDEATVTVPATGSGSGRTDLVAVVVEDPQYTDQPSPTASGGTVANGPYTRIRVYQSVAGTPSKLSDVDPAATGYALARYTLGASDGTIEAADIVDLREVPRAQVGGLSRILTVPNGAASETLTSTAYVTFPAGATWQVPVPAWAIRATLELDALLKVSDDATEGGNVRGHVKLTLGTVETPAADYDESTPGANKTNTFPVMAGGDVTIPAAMRGTTQTLKMQAHLSVAATGGMTVRSSAGTVVRARVTYYEAPDATFWTA